MADNSTQIVVPSDLSDEVAMRRFLTQIVEILDEINGFRESTSLSSQITAQANQLTEITAQLSAMNTQITQLTNNLASLEQRVEALEP